MRTFTGIAEARDAAQDFYYANRAGLPEHVEEKLAPLFRTGTSPVDAVVRAGETIYANGGDLSAEARELGAGLADLRDSSGYHRDDREPDRAAKIRDALSRSGKFKTQEGDPVPLPDLLPPPPPVAPPAPPAGE